jgi:pilus assembly protein FimV
MERTVIQLGTGMIGICLCVVVSAAQTAGGSNPHRSESGTPMTVSGCLLQISASSSEKEQQFVLANARRALATAPADAPEPGTPGSGGVSGTAGSGATPQSATGGATPSGARGAGAATVASGTATERYIVTGLGRDELRKHVNHYVALLGSFEKEHRSDRGSAAAGGDRLGGSSSGAAVSSSGATSGLGSVAGSSGSAGTPGAPNPSGASTASGTSTTGATSGAGGVAGSSGSASAPGSKASPNLPTTKTGDAAARSGAIGDAPRFRAASLRMLSDACPSSGTPD